MGHNRLVVSLSPTSPTTQSCATPVSRRRRNSLEVSAASGPIGVSRIVRFCELDRCRQLRSFGMILTTHAIVGAALASFLPSHPAAAFVAGFASHFALDAIPHVDYPIKSRSVNPRIGAPMAFDRALLQDAGTIGFDGLFGIMAALFLFSTTANFWASLLGAIGAMLPDPLQ